MEFEGEVTPEAKLEAVAISREVGELESHLRDAPSYILIAYPLYPNGSTGPDFVTEAKVAAEIGRKAGIGSPTDPLGWGLWEVDKLEKRNNKGGQ